MGYVESLRKVVGHDPLILVGVTVLVFDNNKQLLLQKKIDGRWSLPGGLMELGESAEETGRREVFEETGLQIGELRLVGVFSGKEHFVKLDNGDELYPVTIAYVTEEIMGGQLKADGIEGVEVCFFPLNQLPASFNPRIKELIMKHVRG